ncbi:gpm3p [Saccharomyces arboricola H-6]|uniref:Phosphoglycerate mutase n=1 Tax=Saccharomyces arboricola (strain H-6 / AS 2.3317 / CBS 10644) TaxID=1160507 RepID=J8PWP3_SACAR|nr:gpm3p [Saccharomyces arboricola H-6]
MTIGDTFKLFILRHGQSELNSENIFCGWIDAKLTEKGKLQARHSAKLIKQYCDSNNIPLPQIGYTSRLARTQQTMDVILEELRLGHENHVITINTDINEELHKIGLEGQLPVLQTWRLNERHYGSWQGQRKPNALKEYGKEKYMYIRRDYNGKPPKVDLNLEMIQEENDQGSSTGYDFKEPNRHLKYGLEEKANERLPESESLCEVVTRLKPFLNAGILSIAKQNNQESCVIVGHGSSVRSLLKILEGISDEEIKDIDIPNGIPLVIELGRENYQFVRKFYLDPESAKVNAQMVRDEGFEKNP